jgi:hypothetical protein
MAIIVNTVRAHLEHGYSISCWCPRCKGFVKCSLHRLVMRGRGDEPSGDCRRTATADAERVTLDAPCLDMRG